MAACCIRAGLEEQASSIDKSIRMAFISVSTSIRRCNVDRASFLCVFPEDPHFGACRANHEELACGAPSGGGASSSAGTSRSEVACRLTQNTIFRQMSSSPRCGSIDVTFSSDAAKAKKRAQSSTPKCTLEILLFPTHTSLDSRRWQHSD